MNSVIAGTEFVNPESTKDLTRGQIALVCSDGSIVKADSTVKKESLYKFVVGLGDGHIKEGVWLKPKVGYKLEDYKAPTEYKIVFATINPDLTQIGQEVRVCLTVPAEPFIGNKVRVYYASTNIKDGDTKGTVITRLVDDVKRIIKDLNHNLQSKSITFEYDAVNFAFTFKSSNVTFYANLEGTITSTKTTTGDLFSVGDTESVDKLERSCDVASVGYNPNFIEAYSPYGDIFTAKDSDKYNIYTISSRTDYNHVFNIDTLGMQVTQFVAIVTKSEGFTTIMNSIFGA